MAKRVSDRLTNIGEVFFAAPKQTVGESATDIYFRLARELVEKSLCAYNPFTGEVVDDPTDNDGRERLIYAIGYHACSRDFQQGIQTHLNLLKTGNFAFLGKDAYDPLLRCPNRPNFVCPARVATSRVFTLADFREGETYGFSEQLARDGRVRAQAIMHGNTSAARLHPELCAERSLYAETCQQVSALQNQPTVPRGIRSVVVKIRSVFNKA
ncbi:hypothetical protein KC878_01015 [Candidatus Saccharibacteria bacterium]|nr:hypothetical protein [Candidatus Saccharibacteria bacterium]MCB9821565.1 hypothetical protein [Candidatus Nomurabacteria bacterium]